MTGITGGRDRLAILPRPKPAARARAGWWLTFTDLLALMVASLVLLYAMGAPRLPAGFALPGALDAAPAPDPFVIPRAGDHAAGSGARPALAAVALEAAMTQLGMPGVRIRALGPDGLLLAVPGDRAQELLSRPDAATRLARAIAAGGWTIAEIVAAPAQGAWTAERLAALAAALGTNRAALTLLAAAGDAGARPAGGGTIWLRLRPGEAG